MPRIQIIKFRVKPEAGVGGFLLVVGSEKQVLEDKRSCAYSMVTPNGPMGATLSAQMAETNCCPHTDSL